MPATVTTAPTTAAAPAAGAIAPPQISRLDALDTPAFTALLADIFEHSAWVAERAAPARPFTSVADLHAAMCAAMRAATADEQLALLRAHPELAGRQAQEGELTAASEREQSGAGLKSLSAAEMARISELNAAYAARHGFPFIVCVGRHDKASLFAEFARRVGNVPQAEHAEALDQVADIARLRLDKLFSD